MRRIGGFLAVALAAFWLTAAPAAAIISQNAIGCAGSAVITDGDTEYKVDATDRIAKVPRKGSAAYEGSIRTVTHDHHGQINVKLGPASIPVGEWGPKPNSKDESSAKGVKKLPSALENVPPGKYDVTGFHQGREGRCAGKVTVDMQGGPLSSPVALGVMGATLVSSIGLLAALRAVPAKVKL